MRIKHSNENNMSERQKIVRRILNSISHNERNLQDDPQILRSIGKENEYNWENLPFNKRFKYYQDPLSDKALFLKSNETPNNALTSCFRYVRKVAIEFNQHEPFHESFSKYTHFRSLEQLIITRMTEPIDFILSYYLTEIFITTPIEQNGITRDIVEPLLKICTNVKTFRYYGGVLNSNSISYLRRNPIGELYFNDLTMPNMDIFTTFLMNCHTLKAFKIVNTETAQLCFFSDENKQIQNIETLLLSIKTPLLRSYGCMSKCINLKKLTLIYNSLPLLLTIYHTVLDLPNLKEIYIQNILPPATDEFSSIETNFLAWKTKFAARNILLSRRATTNNKIKIEV